MEEKKITDDTEIDVGMIVKALECCMGVGLESCVPCPYHEICKEDNGLKMNSDCLTLIQRLQINNARLKYALLEAKNNMLAYGAACVKEGYEKAKQQIEQLLEERENMQAVIFGLEEDKRQLQKQVDELTKEEPNIVKIIEASERKYGELYREAKEIVIQQAVKDTAKEILQYVGDLYDDCDQRFQLKDYQWHKELCKKYGVEVE